MITDVIEVCETSICRHAPLLLAPDGGSCTWHQWPHPPSINCLKEVGWHPGGLPGLIDCVACTCQRVALACMVDHYIVTSGSLWMWLMMRRRQQEAAAWSGVWLRVPSLQSCCARTDIGEVMTGLRCTGFDGAGDGANEQLVTPSPRCHQRRLVQ